MGLRVQGQAGVLQHAACTVGCTPSGGTLASPTFSGKGSWSPVASTGRKRCSGVLVAPYTEAELDRSGGEKVAADSPFRGHLNLAPKYSSS
jgi:hypothetical protein